jgi:chaperonin GroES
MKLLNGMVAISSTSGNNERKTASGLYIPQTDSTSNIKEGVVVDIGPPEITINGVVLPVEISNGDRVMFNAHYFTEISIQGASYYVGKQNQILAIFEDK